MHPRFAARAADVQLEKNVDHNYVKDTPEYQALRQMVDDFYAIPHADSAGYIVETCITPITYNVALKTENGNMLVDYGVVYIPLMEPEDDLEYVDDSNLTEEDSYVGIASKLRETTAVYEWLLESIEQFREFGSEDSLVGSLLDLSPEVLYILVNQPRNESPM